MGILDNTNVLLAISVIMIGAVVFLKIKTRTPKDKSGDTKKES